MRSARKGAALAASLSGGLALLAPGRAAALGPSPLPIGVIYNYGESETARSAAMGGALRALGDGTTSIFLDPAAMAESRTYHIEAGTQVTPETRGWLLGATVVDSVTSRLAGSFSLQGTPIAVDPSGIDRSWLDLRLGLAFPITDRFIIGLTGRYLKATQSGIAQPGYGFGFSSASGGLIDPTSPLTGPGATPGDAAGNRPDRLALVNTFTFDAGIIIRPIDSISIAVVGQNLTYANNGFLPMIVGGGVGYKTDTLAIEADGLADLSSYSLPGALKPTARIMGGAEYILANVVPLRAGYRYDAGAKLNTLSLGTGYVGPSFAVEGSVKQTVSSPGATTVFLSVAYFLESSGGGGPTARPTPTSEVAQ
jgi:hypothetical protein